MCSAEDHDEATRIATFRGELRHVLTEHELEVTPQALDALAQSALRTEPEAVGDTDSLLVGLLYSGSYTVDVLESAGVDPYALRSLAESSAPIGVHDWIDPITSLFHSHAFWDAFHEKPPDRPLETADILRAAIQPERHDRIQTVVPADVLPEAKPFERTELIARLQHRVLELLCLACVELKRNPQSTLRQRDHRLTDAERKHIEAAFAHGDFVADALESWFLDRQILTDPTDVCLAAVVKELPCLFGAEHFANSGGNLKFVEPALKMATRFSPERDFPSLVLFSHDGRISVANYTYRNRFAVDSEARQGETLTSVSVQAVRPVSLIPERVLREFEDILSRKDVKEVQIQHFLERHPQILQALGYSRALPHIALRADDGSELIPDFMLELPGRRGFDLLELKLPQTRPIALHPRPRPSAELMKAVSQLRDYEKAFERPELRRSFQRSHGMAPFKPQLIVVMGREEQMVSGEQRLLVESQLADIRLCTFDELLEYGYSRAVFVPSRS